MSLADVWHYFSGDLAPSNTGDLASADGITRGQQRILRRLLTNPGDYIWHPEYGAGLPQWIGRPIDKAKIIAIVQANLLLEDSVASDPPPVVAVSTIVADPTAFTVSIQYTDNESGVATTLTFDVTQ